MNYTQILSNEEIKRWAPSAFAAQPYHTQSSRYAFIPTSAVIDGMRQAGFLPVKASQSRSRIEVKRGFTKHMIRFRSDMSPAVVGNSVLEAVLINSHDGSSAYKLLCGVFRFVCSNGMVVADSLLESIHIRHQGDVIQQVIDGSHRILKQAPKVQDTIAQWSNLLLAPAEQKLLAQSAHSLRFPVDEETGKANTEVIADQLLAPRRSNDSGSDLWSTFNRVQENCVKGIKKRWNRPGARAIKGIDQDVRLNRALWTLAEKFAELKQTA